MNKSFKGEYVPFISRLTKRLVPLILIVILALFKLYFGRSSETLGSYRAYFFIFIVICFIIGIYFQTNKIRTIVNEIKFTDDSLHIIGQDFNSKFEDKLNINKVIIEIQEEELSRNKSRYCLEIYSDDKYYYLNKFNDWKYSTLAEVVDEFKLKTEKLVSNSDLYPLLKDN
ncbi:hypothetical protein [Flavobacterium sp.]|uniref:hypothetical protein n=1 Tax=Flavobacterium sp. TaxID=239 RepID=UPI002628817A|nr:hypothetical protein [Flavobacterium sp.]